MKWNPVTKTRPCAVCGKPDWCATSEDGRTILCNRVQSPRQARGGGYYHSAETAERQETTKAPTPPPLPDRTPAELAAMFAEWTEATNPEDVARLAGALGLPAPALASLAPAWTPRSKAWAFAMRAPSGELRGIRLRAPDGTKYAVRGSRDGLFLPTRVDVPTAPSLTLILEGPTDTAAAVALGFRAIGRPSCRGAADLVAEYFTTHRGETPVVVADADGPGVAGAEALAALLPPSVRVIRPPGRFKDLRDVVRLCGATKTTAGLVASIIAATPPGARRLCHG